MPPRVAYWLSSFEPEMEAVASEVALLRGRFAGSVAWGLSPRHWALFSRRRGFCLHPRLHLAFRAATRLFEPAFAVNHVFGSLGDWFYLEGRRRRPTVLTLATTAEPVDRALLDRVRFFVAEDPATRDGLRRSGIDESRIRLIFPPVDLDRFRPAPPPDGPFTVLFASSPERADWLEGRGVFLLLDAAALCPTMRFRLLWRPWGDSRPVVERAIRERGLTNVDLVDGRRADMAREYQSAHATVAPFVRAECCKPAPNSILESLACGRPVVTTTTVGLSELIEESDAGARGAHGGASIAEALEQVRDEWASRARAARELAERRFGAARFVAEYETIYAASIG